jgi:surfeit locus 1 family protein
LGLTIATAIAFLILAGLGVWQLQRLAWKTDLLARIAALQNAPARPLEALVRTAAPSPPADYTRVTLDCPGLEETPTLHLYALLDGVAGHRLITACPLDAPPYRSVLVDRGFLAEGATAAAPTPLHEPVVGVLRSPEKSSPFAAPDQPGQNLWYRRTTGPMAAALKAPYPLPTFLMLERPSPRGGGPVAAPIPLDIPNRHFEYALTWFGLALALLGVYIAKRIRDAKA